jgi:hypothetical protein
MALLTGSALPTRAPISAAIPFIAGLGLAEFAGQGLGAVVVHVVLLGTRHVRPAFENGGLSAGATVLLFGLGVPGTSGRIRAT